LDEGKIAFSISILLDLARAFHTVDSTTLSGKLEG